MTRRDRYKARSAGSTQLSKPVEGRFDGDAGLGFECPYSNCSAAFETPDARREHMFSAAHAEETRQRQEQIAHALALRTDWRAQAACLGLEMIVEPTSKMRRRIVAGGDHLSKLEAAAVTLCAGCPVRWECAELSINPPEVILSGPGDMTGKAPPTYEVHGTWAGTRPHERRQVVEALGHGDEAVRALLAIGERRAQENPGDPSKLKPITHHRDQVAKREKAQVERAGRNQHLADRFGGPGPGRGKLGPAGLYAREHGVSLTTARLRLQRQEAA